MLSFTPSLNLEKELKLLQSEMTLLVHELKTLGEAELTWLHKSVLISTIGASTRIENAVLTDAEIEWVDTVLTKEGKPISYNTMQADILDKLSKDRERSVEEVVGCREILGMAYEQVQDLSPLSESIIRGMHKILLNYYPKASSCAGSYKSVPNLVVSVNHETGEQRTVLEPTSPGPMTDLAMRDLLEWYKGAIKEHPWTLLVATEFVFRFLAIHPFQDGNGRLGRVLFLVALMQGDDPIFNEIIPYISIDRHIERHRALYYMTLHQVSGGQYRSNAQEYNLEPLVWFFLKMIRLSLKDVPVLRFRYKALQGLSENAQKVLACFKASPEKRISPAEIVQQTGIVRRTVQNSLGTLLKVGFIQRLGKGAASRYQLIF